MTEKIDGELEIDRARGVIYFHCSEGTTILRICSLPKPIPIGLDPLNSFIDITVTDGFGVLIYKNTQDKSEKDVAH